MEELYNSMSLIEKPLSDFPKLNYLIRYTEGHNGIISGGCFKSIFTNQTIRDIDMYFESIEDFNNAINYYSNNKDFTYVGVELNVVMFKCNITNKNIDLIKSFFGDPNKIMWMTDFNISRITLFRRDGKLFVRYIDTWFEDLANKKLTLNENIDFLLENKMQNIKRVFHRTYKYKYYGFSLSEDSKTKLLECIKKYY